MNDFKEHAHKTFEQKETEELIKIAFVENADFRPEALELARELLRARGVDTQSHEVEREKSVAARAKANPPLKGRPLTSPTKTLCVVLPLVGMVIAGSKSLGGNRRASGEAWAMVGYGFLLRLAIAAIWSLL